MPEKILITGGAGFIGSHLADELLDHGYEVRALDLLTPQVHGPGQRRPASLDPRVELHVGDVRDPRAVRAALDGVDGVFHCAAAVGVGQSMYRLAEYTSTNNVGTAVLLEALIERPVQRLVVASSRSIYGEGLYVGPDGARHEQVERGVQDLKAGRWEPTDADGDVLEPVPTNEAKAPSPASVDGLSKHHQERLCLLTGRVYGVPTTALRLFDVYGPRQALSNPYTGVLAIFAARLLNDRSPLVFEDGLQRRDFVSVHDVARGSRLAYEADADQEILNLGSGRAATVLEVALGLAAVLGRDVAPEVTRKHRVGDIRHCFADIGRARDVIGYAPQVALDDGLRELAEWLGEQEAVDRVDQAASELQARGLTL